MRERVSQVDEEVGEVVAVKVVEFTTLKQVSDFVVTLRKGDALPLHLYEIYFTDNLSDAALRNTNELAVAFWRWTGAKEDLLVLAIDRVPNVFGFLHEHKADGLEWFFFLRPLDTKRYGSNAIIPRFSLENSLSS